MKNILKVLCSVMLIAVFALTMAGCDKSGSIKTAFENEGYTVTSVNVNDETSKAALTLLGLTDEQIEQAGKYEVVLCVKGITNSCAFIKFSSASEIKEFLTVENSDGEKDTSIYDAAKEDGRINGNCLYFGLSAGKEIFKNA